MPVKRFLSFLAVLGSLLVPNGLKAQNSTNQPLSAKQRNIVVISALTAKGDLSALRNALNKGLDGGLTINEVKEELAQLYAYCGFPRSLNGLNMFMTVLDVRQKKGITDEVGKEPTPVANTTNKYETGKKTLEALTGRPETGSKTGFASFSPEIDIFLKEHLFADIFGRGVLSYPERELVTIAALASLNGVELQLLGHLDIGLNVGLTQKQLKQLFQLIQLNIGKKQADAGRRVLLKVNSK